MGDIRFKSYGSGEELNKFMWGGNRREKCVK